MDLFTAIPYKNMDEEKRDKIWDDGVHLTEAGYDLMGDVVADRLIDLLETKERPWNEGRKER